MKNEFSIVIVCKNEAAVIRHLLDSAQAITNDVVVYDNGSTDETVAIAQAYKNVQVHQGVWQGFGATKQKATRLAKHDWILSLDADEAPDETLQQALAQLTLTNTATVYEIAFKNFLGDTYLKWGEWGFDKHIRLFHRGQVQWNDAQVHEQLQLPKNITIKKLHGSILHRTVKDVAQYSQKATGYALLNAAKYHAKGKKATFVKRYVAPPFTFLKFYVFKLGFLDGWEGFVCARMTAYYTFLKYARLYELTKLNKVKS
ncbi:MAG TPA: glycosyltransferase family 2 protein [Chitinophagaceae bacterium]|nr:glycosyltransferase family 2 protein [Chitinophagaceae bacterium]